MSLKPLLARRASFEMQSTCKQGTNRHRISSNGRVGTVPVFQQFGQPWPERWQVDVQVATNLRESRKGERNHHKINGRGQSPACFNSRECPCFKALPRYVRFDPTSSIEFVTRSIKTWNPRHTTRPRIGPIELRHRPNCHSPRPAIRGRVGRVAHQVQNNLG